MTSAEFEAFREEIIESMERSAEVYGLSRSAGRIYGVVFFAEEPLSIPELVDETGYAKSTISNVTRKLTRIGLIRRRSSGGGGRRVRFEPVTDLWFVLQDVAQQYAQREISVTRRSIDRARERLDGADLDELDDVPERLAELEATYGELERLLELLVNHPLAELIDAIEQYETR